MNICLINPPRLLVPVSLTGRATPPLGLALIASSMEKSGCSVRIIDANAEAPQKFTHFKDDIYLNGLNNKEIIQLIPKDTDIVGISCMFTNNWLHTKTLISDIGKAFPQKIIIAGGEHVSAIPEQCLNDVLELDIVVIGEGEETISVVLDTLKHKKDLYLIEGICFRNSLGEIVTTKRRARIKNVEVVNWPSWHLFPLDKYEKHKLSYGVNRGISLPIMATRGCPYECTFCSSPHMWGRQYYMRSPEDVVAEIKYMNDQFGANNFDFYDLTAIIKREWIIDFSKKIIDSGLKITWQIPAGTRAEAIDEEIACYLYQTGCRNITYAPESGSTRILKLIKKKVTKRSMLKSIKASNNEKLNVKLNLIIGFPEEKHIDILKTLFFIIQASWHGANDAIPSIYSAYPGSEYFNRLSSSGKLLYNEHYLTNIIYSDTFHKTPSYNEAISASVLRLYVLIAVILFYSSNYIFRPWRLLKTIYNIITKNYESRGEITLGEILKRKIIQKKTLVKVS